LSSFIWYGILAHLSTGREHTKWIIGSGDSISFWLDVWLEDSLVNLLQIPSHSYHLLNERLSTFIVNGKWRIPSSIAHRDATVLSKIHQTIIPRSQLEDKLVWRSSVDGNHSAKQAYFHLFPLQAQIGWTIWIWHNFVPPSTSFVAWRCFHNKMPTNDNLITRGCIVVSVCDLCLSHYETTHHMFLSCPFASQL
jgi:hypothetical protein